MFLNVFISACKQLNRLGSYIPNMLDHAGAVVGLLGLKYGRLPVVWALEPVLHLEEMFRYSLGHGRQLRVRFLALGFGHDGVDHHLRSELHLALAVLLHQVDALEELVVADAAGFDQLLDFL